MKEQKYSNVEIVEMFILPGAPSDDPFPIWRPWYRRFTDWLLRRPVPMTSQRLQLDEYLTARYGVLL